ncbi:MAG: hypothetical protein ACREPW_07275 [Candidatus Binataceae bacterium]
MSKRVRLSMVKNAVGEYEDLLSAKGARAAAGRPAGAANSRARLMRAALAMTALALAAVGALLIWSQSRFAVNPSHATLRGTAVRPAAESYMTGSGISSWPVAPAVNSGSFGATLWHST